jgi:signal transduction histidine kinase
MVKRITPSHVFYGIMVVTYLIILFAIKLQDPAVFLLWLVSAIAMLIRMRFHQYINYLYIEGIILAIIIYFDQSLALLMIPYIMVMIYKNRYLIFGVIISIWILTMLKLPLAYGFYSYQMLLSFVLYQWKKSYDSHLRKRDQWHHDAHIRENEKIKMMSSLDELSRISILSERDRIAHKLHDNLGHELTGALLSLRAYEMSQDHLIEDDSFKTLKVKLEQSVSALKETVSYTKPQESYGMDRVRALIEAHPGPAVDLKTTGNMLKLSQTHYFMMATVIKEGLTNILKHADAKTIEIRIEVVEPVLRLMIKNDGIKSKKSPSGVGLSYMRKTIEAVGGTLTYQRNDKFILICVMPLALEGGL